jgi:hypothetical protein
MGALPHHADQAPGALLHGPQFAFYVYYRTDRAWRLEQC